jgi:hypothetical protein
MSLQTLDTSRVTRVWTTTGAIAVRRGEQVRAVPGFLVISGRDLETLIVESHVVAVERTPAPREELPA